MIMRMIALALLALSSGTGDATQRALVITGLGGDLGHAEKFADIGGEITLTLRQAGYGVRHLAEPDATRESIRAALDEASSDGQDDALLVVLIGHADVRDSWRFHLPGEDMSVSDLHSWLEPYKGEIRLVLLTPFAGRASEALAHSNRAILSAMGKKERDMLAAPEAFSATLKGLNSKATFKSIFVSYQANVKKWFDENHFLAKETPEMTGDASASLFGRRAAEWKTTSDPLSSVDAADPFQPEFHPELTSGSPSADAEILFRLLDIKVNEAGVMTTRRRDVIRVQSVNARDAADLQFSYNPTDDTWSLLHARIIRADTVISVGHEVVYENEYFSDGTPWAGKSMTSVEFRLPAMEVGSIADVEYTRTDRTFAVAAAPGLDLLLADNKPIRKLAVRITLPKRLSIRLATRRVTGLVEKETRYGRVFTLVADSIPALAFEPFSPPLGDVAPRIVLANEEKWSDIARWYDRVSEASRAPDSTVASAADRAIKGDNVMPQLYDWVARAIRYVSVPLGTHAYHPSPAAGTLRRGYGDCKDKAALLICALANRNIPAHFVLIGAGGGELISEVPRRSAFNHAIVAVPRDTGFLFLDPTSEVSPYGTLPVMDEGREALIITRDTGIIVMTPISPADRNTIDIERTGRQTAEGLLVGETRTYAGQAAFIARSEIRQAPADAVRLELASRISSHLPGAVVLAYDHEGLDSATAPFVEHFTYRIPVARGLLPIPLGGFFGALPSAPRAMPIRLPSTLTVRETSVVERAGFETAAVPAPLSISNSAGSLELSSDASTSATLMIHRTILLPEINLPAASYEDLVALLGAQPLFVGGHEASSSTHYGLIAVMLIGAAIGGAFITVFIQRRSKS